MKKALIVLSLILVLGGVALAAGWNPIADVNKDGVVDIRDISIVARAFGTTPGMERWNPAADINGDLKVDIKDISIVAQAFGTSK